VTDGLTSPRRAGNAVGLRRWAALALAAVAVAIVSLQAAAEADRASARLQLKKVGSFEQPTHVGSAPGFRRLVYVVEQRGTVAVLRDGQRLRKPFLDIRGRVSSGGERGLLSIAFDPHFGSNRLLYVCYTNPQGMIEVDEFRAPVATRAARSSRRQVIAIPHPGHSNHNGGQIAFGPDGYLYVGTGDGGGANDVDDNARHLSSLLGKLLRINPHRRGDRAYAVPGSNPFVGRIGARPEIYSYGLRNPWRFSFNPPTGTLAIGDVGQGQQEELSYTKIERARGANYGWPKWEGTSLLDAARPDPNPNPPAPVFPILTYTHARGCAIVGGYVVGDPRLKQLKGRYLYTDLCNGVIRSVLAGPGQASDDRSTGLHVSTPSSFGVGAAGQIYVASTSGPVYQLVQAPER
jgi:glucose/arabinose dehydrogenase